jgi:hypothetical protein
VASKSAVSDPAKAATITPAVVASEQDLVSQFYSAGLVPNKVDMSKYITSQFNSTASGS